MSLFLERTQRFPHHTALQVRRNGLYQNICWDELAQRVYTVAAGLIACGVQPGDRVGLLSENRLEWIVADYAILAVRAVAVALHSLSHAAQVQQMRRECTPQLVFVSAHAQRDKVQSFRRDRSDAPALCCFEGAAEEPRTCTLAALEARGEALLAADPDCVRRRARAIQPGDLAAILYTSGTTGELKGVMLTHRNFVFTVRARSQYLPVEDAGSQVALLWLPLSHVYARTCDLYAGLEAGRTVALGEGLETLARDLQETRPHFLSGVPRMYEKLAALARPQWEAGDREALRRLFGERIVYCSCGGAGLAPEIARFYQQAGVPVYQGYGLTETSPTISANYAGRHKLGTSGVPIPGIEVRIAPDGEIGTRGPHVMQGYWQNPQATAEVMDAEGWLHTGDLGRLDAEGFLLVLGRKKDLIVTAYGKNIAPQQIEGLLCFDPYIEQAFVYGDDKPFLTALLVPSAVTLQAWARQQGLGERDDAALVALPEVQALFEQRIAVALADLAPHEQIRRFTLLSEPFSVGRGEITVTAKLRREQIGARYREALESLYHAGN
jgi:long-chain acyl-CoA synthetase